MSYIDNLPKAPGTGATSSKNQGLDLNEQLDMFDKDLTKQSFEEKNVTPEEIEDIPLHKNANMHANIPVELMDTRGFDTAIQAARRARLLASSYTKYAEKNELPPIELLQSDDALALAVQETLVKRAREFYDTSRSILEATLSDDGGADELLDSEPVSTIDALFEINESASH